MRRKAYAGGNNQGQGGEPEVMARHFIYVFERILKEENAMKAEFRKIPINGRRTSGADQKKIRRIISNASYRIAQECDVLVSYPRMRIEGTEVVLGEAHIMLPDCRIVNIKQLEDIEKGRKKQ